MFFFLFCRAESEAMAPPSTSTSALVVSSASATTTTTTTTTSTTTSTSSESGGKQSWLLRWFESKLFDISYALGYLFNAKEAGVQTYIGNRIFSFPERDVDFYLQQFVNMYIHMHDVAQVLHPYLVSATPLRHPTAAPLSSST